jgi:hypothetical protein
MGGKQAARASLYLLTPSAWSVGDFDAHSFSAVLCARERKRLGLEAFAGSAVFHGRRLSQ